MQQGLGAGDESASSQRIQLYTDLQSLHRISTLVATWCVFARNCKPGGSPLHIQSKLVDTIMYLQHHFGVTVSACWIGMTSLQKSSGNH